MTKILTWLDLLCYTLQYMTLLTASVYGSVDKERCSPFSTVGYRVERFESESGLRLHKQGSLVVLLRHHGTNAGAGCPGVSLMWLGDWDRQHGWKGVNTWTIESNNLVSICPTLLCANLDPLIHSQNSLTEIHCPKQYC